MCIKTCIKKVDTVIADELTLAKTSRSGPAGKSYIVERGDVWYYRRRVPKHVAHVDTRKIILRSTKQPLDMKAEAQAVGRRINAELERSWTLMLEGAEPSTLEADHAKAIERARRLGFPYRTASELAVGPLDEIVARVAALIDGGLSNSKSTINAALGGVDVPVLTLGQLAARYFEHSRDRQRKQKPEANRNWKNRRNRVVEIAVAQMGDRPLSQITRGDALEFRGWLIEQVEAGEWQGAYANKILGNLSTMCRDVSDKMRLDLDNPFTGLALSDAADRQRPSFPDDHVADVLLGPRALLRLNAEARAVVAIVASTGMRPVEVAHLDGVNIVLDADVPHVQIRDGLKVKHTARDVPLVGSALAAARAFPAGLKRYRGKNAQLTSAVGKYFRENDLLPTVDHSLYSLRHTFKSRLQAAEAPEDLVDQLMGHKSTKPRYGTGYPLDVLARWVERVAFDAPVWLP